MHRLVSPRQHLPDLLRRRPQLDPTSAPADDPAQRRRLDRYREVFAPTGNAGAPSPERVEPTAAP